MRKIILIIILSFTVVSIGYCQENLAPQEELVLLRKKIAEIESQCTPQKGTPKEEVERIFGKGKPAHIGKLPDYTVTPDSPNRSYELCKDGVLLVHYKDWRVQWAHYIDPYSVKGRFKKPSIEEQLQEARPRLKQLETIQVAYLKRINELNKPLQLTIKSDKQVYELGEEIILFAEFKNTSDEPIKTADYYKPGPISFYFKNESDQRYCKLSFIDLLRRIMSVEFAAGQSDKQGPYNLDLLKGDSYKLYTGDENYRIIGMLNLYMVDGNLTSNTIQIEVVKKGSINISPNKFCQSNEDCKWIRDFCGCQDLCLNKFVEIENCPENYEKCKFGGFDTLICYCENNQCVQGPRE
ncbi:MAG: hypothetical protein ABIJ41_07780 [Candidatus Omnitrophota bacterium]